MPEFKVAFNCDDLVLEGFLALPEGPSPCAGVVLCHPHPLYGGNMDNNVIRAVSEALVFQGLAALRFNFRGVGSSDGSYGDGAGEEEDAHSAITYLSGCKGVDAEKIGILGYSFGGMVALSAGVRNDLVQALVGVSPVISPGFLQKCYKPLLLLYGTEDEVVSPAKITAEAKGIPGVAVMGAIEGADHFFWGYEEDVAAKAATFLNRRLR